MVLHMEKNFKKFISFEKLIQLKTKTLFLINHNGKRELRQIIVPCVYCAR